MDQLRTIDAAPTTAVGRAIPVTARKHGEMTWTGATELASADAHVSAGIDRDLYAIARCVSSEAYASGAKYSAAIMLGIAECVVNEARAAKRSPWSLLTERTSSSYAWTARCYGEQKGRYASTRVGVNGRGLAAARLAVGGSTLVRGARGWMAPKVNDGGKQGTSNIRDAISVARGWAQSGREWIGTVPGVDSYLQAFFRQVPTGVKASTVAFEAMVRDGRAGRSTLAPPLPGQQSHDAADPGAGGASVAVGVAVAGALIVPPIVRSLQ